jgi:hypothetical protein
MDESRPELNSGIEQDLRNHSSRTRNGVFRPRSKPSPAWLAVITAGVCLAVGGLCFTAYAYFTKTFLFAPTPQNLIEDSAAPDTLMVDRADYPRWDASTATQPLGLAFFSRLHR